MLVLQPLLGFLEALQMLLGPLFPRLIKNGYFLLIPSIHFLHILLVPDQQFLMLRPQLLLFQLGDSDFGSLSLHEVPLPQTCIFVTLQHISDLKPNYIIFLMGCVEDTDLLWKECEDGFLGWGQADIN